MAEITASLVVEFTEGGAGDDAFLSAEIDSRDDGLNNGITSFKAGDSPGFLVFKSSNVSIVSIAPSAGTILPVGTFNISESQILTFARSNSANLSKPPISGLTTKWLGNNLGAPTLTGNTTVQIPTSTGCGVLKVDYTTQALAYRIANVPSPLNGEVDFSVLVCILGSH